MTTPSDKPFLQIALKAKAVNQTAFLLLVCGQYSIASQCALGLRRFLHHW
jgi:hypothetical protein